MDLLTHCLWGAAGLKELNYGVELLLHEVLAIGVELAIAQRDLVADLVRLLSTNQFQR